MRPFLLLMLLVVSSVSLTAQQKGKTENVVVITMDGMRRQEIFNGVDEVLMNDSIFNHNRDGTREKFWAPTPEQRRSKLLPFFWHVIAAKGQVYGNRKYNNKMDVSNPYWFSYPGYNEIFTGYPDTAVNSNDKLYNKNETVLEFLNKQKGITGKVAAFASWDVFPYILNEPRSGVYVNADVDTLLFNAPALKLINDMQFLTTRPIDVRPDIFTYMAAREYLKSYKPRLLYIAFDETDDFAHEGMYDQYLKSAYSQDAMIADLWKTLQAIPQYRNKTTLIITCDHGRGDKKKSDWQHHGAKIEGANETWLIVMGPDTRPLGELKTPGQIYQGQIATTLAKLLGYDFKPVHPVKLPVATVFE